MFLYHNSSLIYNLTKCLAGQAFYIKSAYIYKYWDVPGKGAGTNADGKQLAMWDLDEEADRKFKFSPSGDNSWIFIQAQNGGRVVDIQNNGKENGLKVQLWDSNKGNAQKFAIMFTSPTTCVFRTHNWKAIDIKGGHSDDWKNNGAKLNQYSPHYGKNQQFQLIYADGPNKGKGYIFEKAK